MCRRGIGAYACARLAAALLSACAILAVAGGPLLGAPSQAHAATETFALLADTHLGLPYQTAYEEAEQALLWAEELPNLKAVCVAGDLTDRGDPVSYSEWEYLCNSILQDAVALQALGDHDTGKNGAYLKVNPSLTVENGYRHFLDLNGGSVTSFRQFKHANIMTVGGISARGHSVMTNSMIKQLNTRLKKTARQGKMAIVVCHFPYWSSSLNMRSKFLAVLRSYPNVIYVSGDKHRYARSQLCATASPSCSTTPYARTGAVRSRKYSLTCVGVNACSTYRSGDYSYGDVLRISDSGAIKLQACNITKGRVNYTRTIKQPKSSVTVRASGGAGLKVGSARFVFRIAFSDGGTYGGVKSGDVFSLKPGKAKRFGNVPAGVLVTCKQVRGPKGWTHAKTQFKEVAKTPQAITMKARPVTSKAKSAKSVRLQAASSPAETAALQ